MSARLIEQYGADGKMTDSHPKATARSGAASICRTSAGRDAQICRGRFSTRFWQLCPQPYRFVIGSTVFLGNSISVGGSIIWAVPSPAHVIECTAAGLPQSDTGEAGLLRPKAMPRSARSAALFERQMRPSSRNRVNAGQRLSIYSIALATSLPRESLARCSRPSPRAERRSLKSQACRRAQTAEDRPGDRSHL